MNVEASGLPPLIKERLTIERGFARPSAAATAEAMGVGAATTRSTTLPRRLGGEDRSVIVARLHQPTQHGNVLHYVVQ